MDTQPIAADHAEQQWIAKYRRAIEANIPAAHSRSGPFRKRITEALEKVLSSVGEILEPCVRVQWPRSKTAVKHSAAQIDHSKLRPNGLTIGNSAHEKAS
jgi:hypothetical protein